MFIQTEASQTHCSLMAFAPWWAVWIDREPWQRLLSVPFLPLMGKWGLCEPEDPRGPPRAGGKGAHGPATAPVAVLTRPHWTEAEMKVPDVELLTGCREAMRAGQREVPIHTWVICGYHIGVQGGVCTWCPLSPLSASSQCSGRHGWDQKPTWVKIWTWALGRPAQDTHPCTDRGAGPDPRVLCGQPLPQAHPWSLEGHSHRQAPLQTSRE